MRRIINYFGILILLQFFCSCERQPFEKIDFQAGDYKLYFFIPLPNSPVIDTLNDFSKIYKNFFITDRTVLEKISNNILGDKVYRQRNSNSFYILRLEKDSEVIDGGILDIENDMLLYVHGNYEFKIDDFEKFNNVFNRLNSYEVNCLTITNTRRFFDFIAQTDGFIYGSSEGKNHPILDFRGVVELKVDADYFGISSDYDISQRKVDEDFKTYGKVKLLRISWSEDDSVAIKLACEKDFFNNLPNEYSIVKHFTDSIDLPVQVYDVKQTDIVNFFEKESITDYTIQDLN